MVHAGPAEEAPDFPGAPDITGWASGAMGWDDVGILESGRLADVIAVPGDPLADTRVMYKVALVGREGVAVKRDHAVASAT